MLGDRRRINRLLKPDRRRSSDRRSSNRYTGRTEASQGAEGQFPHEERRQKIRRYVDRVKEK